MNFKKILQLILIVLTFSCSKDDAPTPINTPINTPTKPQQPNFSSMMTTGIVKDISVSGFKVDVNVNMTASGFVVSKRGICLSTSPNPTIDNIKIENPTAGNGNFIIIADEYSSSIAQFYVNLDKNTTYYLKSYIFVEGDYYSGCYYGNEVSFKTTGYVGGSGGYVFYDKGEITNGWRYLEAAPSSLSTSSYSYFKWGNSTCGYSFISGIGNAIGDGANNTTLIKNYCNYTNVAATMCRATSLNGMSDWFLPSLDEAKELYKLKHINFVSFSSSLLTSSQSSNTLCYAINTNGTSYTTDKFTSEIAWQVRRF